jgi:16S rRNA (uracil1498-N3)-methyltransferase
VLVLDNSRWEYQVVLQTVTPKVAEGEVLQKTMNAREPALQLTLYQCLLKSDHFEWVLQKGTELGISKFVPVISERTVVISPEDVRDRKLERWRRILTEAAEQSGRGRLPVLSEVVKLTTAFTGLDHHSLNPSWEEQIEPGLRSVLQGKFNQVRISPVNLFIGPEGGFSREEIQAAISRGVIPVTLKRILRAETCHHRSSPGFAAAGDLD